MNSLTIKRIAGLCLLVTFFSCHKETRFSVPGKPEHPITIHRFDQTFYKTGSSPDTAFLGLYANQIMQVGEPGTPLYRQFDSIFRTDVQMRRIYEDCQRTFQDVSSLEKKLTLAFHRLHHFYPNIPYPEVYMHISGFGESIVSAPGILSASIDKYLGTGYELYPTLYQPFQIQRMYPEKLAADYMTGWVRSEFTEDVTMNQQRLLDYLIYEGKILYFMKVILPDESLENISSFSKEQLEWCKKNEKNMWETILRLQHLYSSDPLIVAKYLGEGPHTSFFPKDSPGRAAVWTGYRMVAQFMDKNEKVSIQELFKTNPQTILTGSYYHP